MAELGAKSMVRPYRILQKLVVLIQKLIIIPSLIVIYFFVIGITLIFVFLFRRRLLIENKKKDSFWFDAEGYSEDINGALRES